MRSLEVKLVRLVGVLRGAFDMVDNGRAASFLFEARTIARSTSRDCKPRLRTLTAVSLLQDWVAACVVEELELVEGRYALSAAKIWFGVTAGMGVIMGFSARGAEDEMARSIAPRRTSKSVLTSPVWEAIFLQSKVKGPVGKNLLSCSEVSASDNDDRRVRKTSSSWEAVYAAKWRVETLAASSLDRVDEVGRVWVFAMPMTRTEEECLRANEKTAARACGDFAM